PKKVSYQNTAVKNIQTKAKELTEKFFKDESINELLVKTKSPINPKEIIQKLTAVKDIFEKTDRIGINDLTYFFDMMFSPDKVTFYEIEKSQVIYYLAKYFDENFIINHENTVE